MKPQNAYLVGVAMGILIGAIIMLVVAKVTFLA